MKRQRMVEVSSDSFEDDDMASASTSVRSEPSVSLSNKIIGCKSDYSEYFCIKKDNNLKTGTCKICRENGKTRVFKMKQGNTSGLRRHLSVEHSDKYSVLFGSPASAASTQQQTLHDFLKNNETLAETEEELLEWMAFKYLPFNFFDDDKSQSLFPRICTKIRFPKRTSMKNKLLKYHAQMRNAVEQMFTENSSNVSFTIDGWSSVGNKSYYGITAHFIDNLWNLRSLPIDFIPSAGKHTGKDIADLFFNFISKTADLKRKLQGITVDNAASNTTFISELGGILGEHGIDFNVEEVHFRCFAHIINLGVQDILRILKNDCDEAELSESDDQLEEDDDTSINGELSLIRKIRTLFKKIKKCEPYSNKLKSCCEATNTKFLNPPIDISTRWNSAYNMMQTAIHLKPAINALCLNTQEIQHLTIHEKEWDILTLVCKYLQHFKRVSEILSGDKYVTLPMAIIGFNILLDKVEALILELDNKPVRDSTDENILLAFQAGRDKLLKHYRKCNWIYGIVLILDPRHKVETFSLTQWGRDLEKASLNEFEKLYKTKYFGIDEENTRKSTAKENVAHDEDMDCLDLSSLFATTSEASTSRKWRLEIDKYLQEGRADKNTDILLWWKDRSGIYPNLSRMARDYLSIPATSVPCERLFSKAGLIITKQRNKLTAESAKTMLCLNGWVTCSLYERIKALMKKKDK